MESDRRKEKGAGGGAAPGSRPGERAARLLAQVSELGNVSAACRELGVDRSAYYRILRATRGAPDPGGAAPARRRNALAPEIEADILRLCLENPEWGCDRLSHYLALTARRVSSPTVQKVLIRHGLGRMSERLAESDRRRSGQVP